MAKTCLTPYQYQYGIIKYQLQRRYIMVKIDGKEYADANEYITDQLLAFNKALVSIYKTEEEE